MLKALWPVLCPLTTSSPCPLTTSPCPLTRWDVGFGHNKTPLWKPWEHSRFTALCYLWRSLLHTGAFTTRIWLQPGVTLHRHLELHGAASLGWQKCMSQTQAWCNLLVYKDCIQRQFFSPPWLPQILRAQRSLCSELTEFLYRVLPWRNLISPFLCRMFSDHLQSPELASSHTSLIHLFALSTCSEHPGQSTRCGSQVARKACKCL